MIKILCVDDDKHITDALARYLEKWGYQALIASDAETGWNIIQEKQPEIVLTDWMMPGMDGPELCNRVRNNMSTHYPYMILLTVKGKKEGFLHGMEAGADDFISKPFNPRELKARLNAVSIFVKLRRESRKISTNLNEEKQRTEHINIPCITHPLHHKAEYFFALLSNYRFF